MHQAPRVLGQSSNVPKLSEKLRLSALLGAGDRGLATQEEEIGRSGCEEPAASWLCQGLVPGQRMLWDCGPVRSHWGTEGAYGTRRRWRKTMQS